MIIYFDTPKNFILLLDQKERANNEMVSESTVLTKLFWEAVENWYYTDNGFECGFSEFTLSGPKVYKNSSTYPRLFKNLVEQQEVLLSKNII